MQKKLTYQVVSRAKTKSTRYEVRDTLITGFYLLVLPSGKKRFYVQLSRLKRVCIGDAAILTVEQARTRAKRLFIEQTEGVKLPDETTLREFVKECKTLSNSNQKRLENQFEDWLDIPMHIITVRDFERWRNRRIKEGKSVGTINRDSNVLKGILQKAVDQEVLDVHPLSRVKPLKEISDKRVRYLDGKELKRLQAALKHCDPQLAAIVTLSLHTGLRRGEIFNLQWADVDFKRKQLTIRAAGTKTGKARHIPLNVTAYETLKNWGKGKGGYVFKGRYGRLVDIKKSYATLMRHADIENFRFHDCRHHFASSLVSTGVPLNTVRELLGHSDLKMTLRYAHLSPSHAKGAVDKITW